jgi:NDP-sugar pyrophosphorylase family protein
MIVAYDNIENTAVKNNVELDENGLVVRYDKEHNDERLRYVESGVLALQKSVVDLISPAKVVSLEMEIFPRLIAERELAAFVTKKRFYDIGTPSRLQEAADYFKVWQ